MGSKNNLRRQVENLLMKDLKPMSATVTQLMRLTGSGQNYALPDLAKIIQKDQSLAARVIRTVNSAQFGLNKRVRTLSHAVSFLGIDQLKSLIYTLDLNRSMNCCLKGYGYEQDQLFRHSLATALAARLLVQKSGIGNAEEAYLYGLLHDIGKMIIDQAACEAIQSAVNTYRSSHRKFFFIERQVLGFDHAEIGAQAAKSWNFPSEICEAISLHHTPERGGKMTKMAYALYLADGLAKTLSPQDDHLPSNKVSIELKGVFDQKNLHVLKLKNLDVFLVREQVKQLVDQYKSIA